MITIVGLGVARGDLTLGALEALTGGGQVLLRTARTPAADLSAYRAYAALKQNYANMIREEAEREAYCD